MGSIITKIVYTGSTLHMVSFRCEIIYRGDHVHVWSFTHVMCNQVKLGCFCNTDVPLCCNSFTQIILYARALSLSLSTEKPVHIRSLPQGNVYISNLFYAWSFTLATLSADVSLHVYCFYAQSSARLIIYTCDPFRRWSFTLAFLYTCDSLRRWSFTNVFCFRSLLPLLLARFNQWERSAWCRGVTVTCLYLRHSARHTRLQ